MQSSVVTDQQSDSIVENRLATVGDDDDGYPFETENRSFAFTDEKPKDIIDLEAVVPEEQTALTSDSVNRELEESWSRIFKVDPNEFPQYRETLKCIEIFLKSRIGHWPLELINLQSKYMHKNYTMGSESYSFKPSPNGLAYASLEIMLACLASNSTVVLGIFDLFEHNKSGVKEKLAIVLVKMLLGCKNISLEKLSVAMNFHAEKAASIASLSKVCRRMINATSNFSIDYPHVNRVIYQNLDSDDPIKIMTLKMPVLIKPKEIIPQREAFIKGLCFDTLEKSILRKRTIFKSESDMFVVEVERWPKIDGRTHFDGNSVKFSIGSDYFCSGVVTLGKTSDQFESLFVDSFFRNAAFISQQPGKVSLRYPFNDSNNAYFEKCIESESVMLFFSKKVSDKPPQIFSEAITSILYKAVLIDYADDLNYNFF